MLDSGSRSLGSIPGRVILLCFLSRKPSEMLGGEEEVTLRLTSISSSGEK